MYMTRVLSLPNRLIESKFQKFPVQFEHIHEYKCWSLCVFGYNHPTCTTQIHSSSWIRGWFGSVRFSAVEKPELFNSPLLSALSYSTEKKFKNCQICIIRSLIRFGGYELEHTVSGCKDTRGVSGTVFTGYTTRLM